jgi:hypothetical protein
MKTAYELAMERLSKTAPIKRLTDEQKAKLAELDSIYAAKLAERDIVLNAELVKAQAAGDPAAIENCQQRLATERQKLRAELEEEKEKVRHGR